MQNFRALGAPPPEPRASGGWGLCPQTPSLRQLGALPPDPHWPPAAGGSAPRPPKQPPHCEFLATRLKTTLSGLPIATPSICLYMLLLKLNSPDLVAVFINFTKIFSG